MALKFNQGGVTGEDEQLMICITWQKYKKLLAGAINFSARNIFS